MSLTTFFSAVLICLHMFSGTHFLSAYTSDPYVEYGMGIASDKTYTDKNSNLAILNVNGNCVNYQDCVSQISSKNADIVCVPGVIEDDKAYYLLEELKNKYTHFYRISSRSLASAQNGLFIASKYVLDNFQFNFFTSEENPIKSVFFDFIVKKGTDSFAHLYVSELQSGYEYVLEKMKMDSQIWGDNVPCLLAADLNLVKGFKIETTPVNLCFAENQENFFLASLTTITKTESYGAIIKELNKMQWDQTSDLLCWRDDSGYIEYDARVKKDNEGNTSGRAGVDYTRESSDGSSFSVGVGAEVNRNSDGETKASAEAHVSGRF